MKKLLIVFVMLSILPIAFGQKTREQLKNDAATAFPDQRIGQIKPSDLRAMINSIIDNTYNPIEDGAPLTASAAATTYQPIQIGLNGTNLLYYRTAANTWAPVYYSGASLVGNTLTISPPALKTVNGNNLFGSGDISINSGTWGAIAGSILSQTDLQSALDAKQPTIATGTTSQFWRGDKTWQAIDKNAVGLANVDNTADSAKPISTATQTALNGKQDALNSGSSVGVGTVRTANLSFEGATVDDNQTTIAVADPTANRTITLPNNSGTVALLADVTTAVSAEATARDNAIAAASYAAGAGAAPGTVELYPTAMTLPAGRLLADGTNGTVNITGLTGTKAAQVAYPTPTAPTVTPASGTYTSAQTVTATADSGATVFYAVGADPTRASTVYSAPITASTTAEYRFAQAKSPGLLSPITSRTYTINTVSYLMDEGFEEVDAAGADGSSSDGYDSAFASTETVTGTGATIDADATDMIGRVGSQSIKLVSTATGNIIKQFDLGSARSALWIKLRLTTTGLYAVNRALVSLADSGGNERFALVCSSGMVGRMLINGTGTNSTAAFVNSAVQYVWIKYQNGAACGVYVSQTDSIPTVDGSGNIFIEGTGGAFDIRYIRIGASISQAITYWYDDIKVSTTAFP